jgi:cytochrome P450
MSQALNGNIPAHVPPELVHNWNQFNSPGMLPAPGNDPYEVIKDLQKQPRVFYALQTGRMVSGNWVVTRADDMRRILTDTDTFSSRAIAGFSQLLGESWDMIPLEVDPPDHAKYRMLLNPLFTPKRINEMTDKMRAVTIELIENVREQQHCEFIEAFARRFPVRIFMQLMGMPDADYDMILDWEHEILHADDIEVRMHGAQSIRVYLLELLADRQRAPRDDMLSLIANGSVENRPLTQTEQLSTALFLFVAGLDTVASTLGFHFRYLAEHPQVQQQLRDHPEQIPAAVEELMRVFSVVVTSRKVIRDVKIAGVQMKAGDVVSLPLGAANYDPAAFDNPGEINLQRSPNLHMGFTVGPHRCIGSNLARRELALAIEEWTRRVPNFRPAPGHPPIARGGAVFGVDELQLVWD